MRRVPRQEGRPFGGRTHARDKASTWLALVAPAVVTARAPAPPLQDHAVTGAGAATSAELVSLEDEVSDSSTRRAGYY